MPSLQTFWTDFESYWYILSKEPIHLSAQNVLFGVLSKQGPLSNLLNYFIIIGKLFLCDCRRSQTRPKIQGLQSKLKIKYETEKNINKHSFFLKETGTCSNIIIYVFLVLYALLICIHLLFCCSLL